IREIAAEAGADHARPPQRILAEGVQVARQLAAVGGLAEADARRQDLLVANEEGCGNVAPGLIQARPGDEVRHAHPAAGEAEALPGTGRTALGSAGKA